jgi:hypothetical protein
MVNEQHRRLVATVDSKRSMRIDVAGHHVCVQDGMGQTWFFRSKSTVGEDSRRERRAVPGLARHEAASRNTLT